MSYNMVVLSGKYRLLRVEVRGVILLFLGDGVRCGRVSYYVFDDLFDIIVDMIVILPVIF